MDLDAQRRRLVTMYLPKHFEQNDRAALVALMRERPLATLVIAAPGGPTADLIPLEFDDAGNTLRGHVARANPLWRHAGAQALAVFTGPEAYISPGWYASKREHGKVVPTWNYTMVQARGVLRAVDDAPWLRALVGRLTDQHEARQAAPWKVDDAPADFVQQTLRAIVGIEIALDALVGKWKVSQNRSAADRAGTAQGLAATNPAMAALVAPRD
ncbi:MAG TPA: FMN-binding negative transcriptional regulator [Burkholderiaceae bacterium]|nr:FMN-binding negative transcriptional regulator [Burkholderiaceae bacterium]